MPSELATMQSPTLPADIEQVIVGGDLSKLSAEQRLAYYSAVCKSLGLNPLTKPFEYLHLNGKLVLYARRDCTDQLRRLHRINVSISKREQLGDVYLVIARATTPDGREDESMGAVSLTGLKGDALANALMRAESKAKRRVTLSICGLGFLDESEVETIPGTTMSPKGSPRQAEPDEGTALVLQEILREVKARHPEPGKAGKEARQALFQAYFGVESWPEVSRLPLARLQAGYERLMADVDDVPDGTPPADASSDLVPAAEIVALTEEAAPYGLASLIEERLVHYPNGMSRRAFDTMARHVRARIAASKGSAEETSHAGAASH